MDDMTRAWTAVKPQNATSIGCDPFLELMAASGDVGQVQILDSPELPPSPPASPSCPPLSPRLLPLAPCAATNSPQAKAKRAPRRLERKAMHKEQASCMRCSAPLAMLLLHGPEAALVEPHQMSMTCMACSKATAGAADAPKPSGSGLRKKKRALGVDGPLSCSACARQVGVGGMRVVNNADVAGRKRGWVEPMFEIEPVCLACWDKYKFCSACGGGGLYRTGRWRPQELFDTNRRNCNLSHDRLGATRFDFEVMRCPDEIPPEFATVASDFLCDQNLKTFAVPKLMETLSGLSVLPELDDRRALHARELKVFLTSPPQPSRTRFACAAWAAATASKPRQLAGFFAIEHIHNAATVRLAFGIQIPKTSIMRSTATLHLLRAAVAHASKDIPPIAHLVIGYPKHTPTDPAEKSLSPGPGFPLNRSLFHPIAEYEAAASLDPEVVDPARIFHPKVAPLIDMFAVSFTTLVDAFERDEEPARVKFFR
ncbi:hypothetical protein BDK51DRAFT_49775 [Blyttiomyces helicus]|uniref:Uncharacterized protein n=1 Tax=Blyttiomyces helicus TaxID=388810 RepID=A0A4V1ISA9_9FUNG|nr:hypothetical protein BDK51DRAFT_49775 [Blyttiomyces helicus]|eukprot:RKO92917.1 hypothetical protein BDK51DRAFT_49775 [Blyttiomyces helicus]